MVQTPPKNPPYRTLAREYILSMQAGTMPDERPDFGPYDTAVLNVERVFMKTKGDTAKVTEAIESLSKNDKAFADLMTPPVKVDLTEDNTAFPELPVNCKANEVLADQASPTLDAIIDFFKYWATRSYDGYHEAVALWVLSTIAARRVQLPWRKGVWTPLYIMLVSDSTAYAKTEAASYGQKILEDCGLRYLLVPDDLSPQKLINNMHGSSLPRNYSTLSPDGKDFVRMRLAFSAQRGWLYDEFGNKLQEIVNAKGHNAYFYGLLKQLYDCKKEYEYDTITRGGEPIQMPYLSIIGTATPACLKPIANRKSAVWTDGFFARIAFIVPPKNGYKLKSAPNEQCHVPTKILQSLISWHERLGIPDCQIIDVDAQEALNEQDGKKHIKPSEPEIHREDLPQSLCAMPDSVYRAHELYYASLTKIANEHGLDERFKSNYGRLPDMALRIAMLLASLENNGHMEMKHWARGQDIAERWRADFHELLRQLSEDDTSSWSETEDKVISALRKLGEGMFNARQVSRAGSVALRTLGTAKVRDILEELAGAEMLFREGGGKSAKYGFKPPDE